MKKIQQWLREAQVRPFVDKMRIGIEKESQRVTLDGKLAKTDHPFAFGCRSYHPMIQTDFSETQIELITPVAQSAAEVMDYLAALHEVTLRTMEQGEMLWPLSMPPDLPEKVEEIRIAKLAQKEEVLYRRYLAQTYGKRKQMVSGVHYNFEFSPVFLERLYEEQDTFETFGAFRDEVYLIVAQNYLHDRWLVTYLFGASPYADKRYFCAGEEEPVQPVRSIRNSHFGYTNADDVKASYESVAKHALSIEEMVEKGILSEEKEFYAPVRLRGGKKVSDLRDYGVRYIEVRNIDINPFAPYGINEQQIRFLQLFLIFMLWQGKTQEPVETWIEEGNQWNDTVALENPWDRTEKKALGLTMLAEMKTMAEVLYLPEDDIRLIEQAMQTLNHPKETYAGKMLQHIEEQYQDNQALGVAIGRHYLSEAFEKPYQLAGFRDLELSTQLLIFEAMKKGVEVSLLDRTDQFLELRFAGRKEYVKNGNMTSKDTYIAALLMENKVVTKKVLEKAGYRVPKGAEYSNVEAAVRDYPMFANQAIVVKPKSTNYGLGISIFKEPATIENFEQAVRLALEEDQSILVEEYMEGTEYRFVVIDGKTEGVMKRVPANIEGDGKKTVEELVREKNEDPLRDKGYRSPLEKLNLGELELLMLQEQGMDFKSIPAKGQIVFLRENSNVSTGGDSIDQTDEVDESYKEIAVGAVAALGVAICGIDIIIPDCHVPAGPDAYGIIEANFNPAMHMHAFPYKGQGRNLPQAVLRLLFPEAYAIKCHHN